MYQPLLRFKYQYQLMIIESSYTPYSIVGQVQIEIINKQTAIELYIIHRKRAEVVCLSNIIYREKHMKQRRRNFVVHMWLIFHQKFFTFHLCHVYYYYCYATQPSEEIPEENQNTHSTAQRVNNNQWISRTLTITTHHVLNDVTHDEIKHHFNEIKHEKYTVSHHRANTHTHRQTNWANDVL